MKLVFSCALLFVAALNSSCNQQCSTCEMYDEQNNLVAEYEACGSDPKQEAEDNFTIEGREGSYTAKCAKVN